MQINDNIVRDYLVGNNISKYREEWYFSNSNLYKILGKNAFEMPNSDQKTKEKIETVYEELYQVVKKFIPTNRVIMDELFDDWEAILEQIDVDLIVGYPKPHDATVDYDSDGKCHIIFDLGCWSLYVGRANITKLVQNLLTHEFCHVMEQKHIPHLAEDITSEVYMTCLDAITFDESFAHLLSYEDKEIGEVDWENETLVQVKDSSRSRMKSALNEIDKEKQHTNLYEGFIGNYYDKYACMCGMFYLVDRWKEDGNEALKRIFDAGYNGFAKKTCY